MGKFLDLILGIVGGIITSGLLYVLARGYAKYLYRHRHSLLYKSLRKYKTIQIVLPSIYIESFGFGEDNRHVSQHSSPNILFMPFTEAYAVSEATHTLNKLLKDTIIRLITPQQFDESLPAICVGGPSVNSLSEKILKRDFPNFQINYPAATQASYDALSFSIDFDKKSNTITKDHGFLFFTRSQSNHPVYVACGILAFGTQAAIKKLFTIKANSDEGRDISSKKSKFLSVNAIVDGYCADMGNGQTRL